MKIFKSLRTLLLSLLLIQGLTLLLVMQSTCKSTRPTSNLIATSQPDRVLIVNKIYAVDKKIDSISEVYSDSLHSANTTAELLSILRQYNQGNQSETDTLH